jgi:hypothetical protein
LLVKRVRVGKCVIFRWSQSPFSIWQSAIPIFRGVFTYRYFWAYSLEKGQFELWNRRWSYPTLFKTNCTFDVVISITLFWQDTKTAKQQITRANIIYICNNNYDHNQNSLIFNLYT